MNAEAKLKENVEEIDSAIKSGSLDTRSAHGKLESAILEYALDGYTDKEHVIHDEEWEILMTHYTSIHTLISMLQSASKGEENFLRMYDSAHSNDPDEGNFLTRDFSKEHASLISDHAYIASFVLSNDKKGMGRDNLAFWRAYGRNGEGCSLSLPASHLRQNLRKVRYGDEHDELVRNFEKKLESFSSNKYMEINSLVEKIKESHPDIHVNIIKTIGEHIGKVRYLYKSGAYRYENECRLVLLESEISSDDVRFEWPNENDDPIRIRHYYEHKDLEIKNILSTTNSKIVIGPCVPHRYDVRYCIEKLLKRAKLYAPCVTVSDIKYRKP